MDTLKIISITLSATAIINCLVIALVLFFIKKGNLKLNRVIGFLLIAILSKLCYTILVNIPHVWGLSSIMVYFFSEIGYMSFGPLLLIFTNTLLKLRTPKYIYYIHVIPVIAPFVGYFVGFDIPLELIQAYFLIFLIAIPVRLYRYFTLHPNNAHFQSEKVWILFMYYSFVVIWMIVNLFFLYNVTFIELTSFVLVVLYVNIYLTFRFYWIKKGDKVEPQKYSSSKLTLDEENEILTRLQKTMEDEKMYIDSELTLSKVADKIKVSPHKLSQVINQRKEMSFNEFINSYRINEIKNAIRLPEYQDIKIASIAYDYGFNTISSFNTAFKKFTNYTPSQYRSEVLYNNQN